MSNFCDKIEDHTPEAFIIDADMNVLLKCTKCEWENIQIVDKYTTGLIDFNKQTFDII